MIIVCWRKRPSAAHSGLLVMVMSKLFLSATSTPEPTRPRVACPLASNLSTSSRHRSGEAAFG